MGKIFELDVTGMTCDGCARHVEKALGTVKAVRHADVPDWRSGKAIVEVDSVDFQPDSFSSAVERAGYGVSRAIERREKKLEHLDNGYSREALSYDLAIIGGGSAAFAAALKASELGARVAIINEGLPIGGTCVNVGCVPSKSLIRAAEAHHRSFYHDFDGIDSTSKIANFGAITSQVQDLVRELRQQKYLNVMADDPQVRIIEGRAKIAGEHTVSVGFETITAGSILIATGARPAAPPIPGLDSVEYLTNETAYELAELPEHLLVLGGGYIALENAQAFARLGSRVTILELLPRILATEGEDVTDELTTYFEQEGIRIQTGVKITSVRHDGNDVVIEAEVEGSRRSFRGSHIFVATGRRGNSEELGLAEMGIEIDDAGYITVDETLRTAVPSIFGAGDVIGTAQFVYAAAYEGQLAAENALRGGTVRRDYEPLPWVVFTDPQVAGVGLDEGQARERGIDVDVSKLSLEHVPRALAARDTRGFIKLIRDRATDRLLGARILAPEGSELLMEASLAIKYGVTIAELEGMLHPYLTMSEGMRLAALTFGRDVKKLSCCAG